MLPLLVDLEVDAADRPGYDGTPAGGFFFGAQRLFERTGERPLLLVGYSWGAGVAIAAAASRPDVVRGLVLVCPVGAPTAVTWTDRLLARSLPSRAFGLAMRSALPRVPVVLGRILGSRLSPDAKRAVRTGVRARDPGATWAAWVVEQRALVAETARLFACLSEIRTPTVVLAGTRDTAVRFPAARTVAARIPDAELRAVPAGHLLPFEEPEAVARAIRDIYERT